MAILARARTTRIAASGAGCPTPLQTRLAAICRCTAAIPSLEAALYLALQTALAHQQQLAQLRVEGIQQAVPLPQLATQRVARQLRRRKLHLQHRCALAGGQVRHGQAQPRTSRSHVSG